MPIWERTLSSLEIRDLTVAYGSVKALFGVDLLMPENQSVCILGSNGAGKSSLLRSIVGLAPVARGAIRWEGNELVGQPTHQAVRNGIALVPEGRRLFPDMTVEDNLRAGAIRASKAEVAASLEQIYDMFPRLKERRQQLAGSMSGGEQQMGAIGRALMSKPRLILMDEPSLGLAPKIIVEVANIVRRIKASGIMVLMVEQNAKLAMRLTEYTYVLERGRIVREGTSTDLLNDPYIQTAYLGEMAR